VCERERKSEREEREERERAKWTFAIKAKAGIHSK